MYTKFKLKLVFCWILVVYWQHTGDDILLPVCCQPSTKIYQQKTVILKIERSFNRAQQHYPESLAKGGHKHELNYNTGNDKKTKRESKNILYFTPPFCLLVQTKIGYLMILWKLLAKTLARCTRTMKFSKENC